ncbi:D-glycero-D-manno-heptose 1,7-bisphosphate phosphatase [Streptoalloteichus tenebrarius]|uniref:D,D-heptose 1,7-bisphosphate phosphatase n=1 Tax=Streptoalloteichus tenebrarius (strain ATCC 17920 / DSM 40477 / JCM 4838 / CBS 697.72 / NBRC 16177 / NCIMB 11028 / NRRL B-12390 / A12253. 1 / ISP 5477) TaxID=1933 RepID=A0ABT1HRX3_STRSD|nr:HAD-IIIA family hydrolase [Streptoalloteichus tenebrarius]MCP2258267.1 D-glycero-D-manno-heptose 1,7-bisphosphate phosphatase [Streptoalloteichus tenebrarius]BFF04503.1 hypothetical protein GCM10020241_61780 [Streptoalloteichus tenebrarius]
MDGLRAAFLDRDGTLNVKPPPGRYVTTPDGLALLPGAAAAVARLNQAGWVTVLVTNQRGVARGLMTEAALRAVHRRLLALLAAEGARLDALYSCVHQKESCGCRKPLPGLFLKAVADNPAIDLSRSVVIGDEETDVLAGKAAGTRAVRLAPPGTPSTADHLATNLPEAVNWLLTAGTARSPSYPGVRGDDVRLGEERNLPAGHPNVSGEPQDLCSADRLMDSS